MILIIDEVSPPPALHVFPKGHAIPFLYLPYR